MRTNPVMRHETLQLDDKKTPRHQHQTQLASTVTKLTLGIARSPISVAIGTNGRDNSLLELIWCGSSLIFWIVTSEHRTHRRVGACSFWIMGKPRLYSTTWKIRLTQNQQRRRPSRRFILNPNRRTLLPTPFPYPCSSLKMHKGQFSNRTLF